MAVAICLNRGLYYIAAIIATWKTGGYFIPLNNRWPAHKIHDVLNDCNPDLVLVEDDSEIEGYSTVKLSSVKEQDFCATQWAKVKPSDLAYVIYTSGSTGKPKGVMITHLAYGSYIDWTQRYFRNYAENRKLLVTAELTFDITMGDLAFSLAFGTEMHIAPDPRNIISIYKFISERNIDTFYSVPTTINALYRFASRKRGANLSSLNLVLSGGDVFPIKLLRTIKENSPAAHFYNVYGPTEMTINCFAIRLDNRIEHVSHTGAIPIGYNFDIIDYAIINEENEDVTDTGGKGKLCVTGPQTMLGYYGDASTTQVSFAKDVRYPDLNRVLYNTNDIAKLAADGLVYLFGRGDNLVKVKGYRIHPDEISGVVREMNNVAEAAAIAIEDEGSTKLHLVVQRDGDIDENTVKSELSKKLPDYMVPENVMFIEKIPFNDAGKVDKIVLQKMLERSDHEY